ncbi:Hypothetical predicted protein [Mytilus galloprovincialis]|uniref:C3H1-type domain-containing protein n=1 Tax=Mytilus galloprovincialis TaxID=29158 RepID=A0A8B6BJM6_MYTGA|nr:Hypothetical predicted protein [Mytilus galloprovincialis]
MGTGISKIKHKDELFENEGRNHKDNVPVQFMTNRENHSGELSSTPINKTPETQTLDNKKESRQQRQRRKKRKNVLNTIAKKPSGTNTYNIEGVSENEIFDFVITTFEKGCTLEDLSLQCDLFPLSVDIPRWFESHTMQFHIFKNNEKIEYILPYVKTADICFGYNNPHFPGKCGYGVNCYFLHVCRRFVRNIYCNFKGCRLAHDFTNPHNSRLVKRFGLENFSENQIKRILNNHSPSICSDYNYHAKCKVGTKKCVNLHLCGSYKFGNCEEPCKFKRSHKLNNNHNKWVLRAFEMTNWPAEKVLKNIYVPPKKVLSYPNAKGDSVRYRHLVDDDDDLNKGSDFFDKDENDVAPRADSSDDNSEEDDTDKLSI